MAQYHVAVGEVDPAYKREGPFCYLDMPGPDCWVCTLLLDHDGPHVAHRDSRVLQIWPEPVPEGYEVDEGL